MMKWFFYQTLLTFD